MTAQEHILQTLQTLSQPVRLADIGNTPVEDAVFARVMSKKFRKLKADEGAIRITKGAIEYAVKNNKPVKIGVLFGGNKLWRFDEAPEVDWAELFALCYYLRWMRSIAEVYEPGVLLEFYSQDVSVQSLNNVPRSETDKYSETFRALLEWMKPYMPARTQFTYVRQAEEYENINDYDKELAEAKEEFLKDNDGKLPILTDAERAATELNVRLRPGQDDDPEWREKVEWEHRSIFKTKTLTPYLVDETIIPTCPTLYDDLIATGSTKKSMAKFWAGVGALEKSGDGYNDLVLTPKQLASANFTWENVDIPGLPAKNFHGVRVLN